MANKVIPNSTENPFDVIQRRIEALAQSKENVSETVEEEEISLPSTFMSSDPVPEESVFTSPQFNPATFNQPKQSEAPTYRKIKVDLPSEGKLYPEGNPVCGVKSVDVRTISTEDEDILATINLIKTGKATSRLIDNVLLTPGIKADDMIVGDRLAVVLALRIAAYGKDYKPEGKVQCDSCDWIWEPVYNLEELDFRKPDEEMEMAGCYFKLQLPESNKIVYLRFLSGKNEAELEKIIKENKKKTNDGIDHTASLRLAHHVIAIDNDTNRASVVRAVKRLDGQDSRAIRAFLAHNEPAIIFKQTIMCSECNVEKVDHEVPVTSEFLYPKL